MALTGTIEQLKNQVTDEKILKGLEFLEHFDAKAAFENDTIRCDDCIKIEIDGDKIYANVQYLQPCYWVTREYEYHKKYIDIHCNFLNSIEVISLSDHQKITKQKYHDVEKDTYFAEVSGFNEEVTIHAGEACIIYPEDVHAPCIKAYGCDLLKKVVIKIAVDD